MLLLFVSMFCFVYYIHHIAQSIRPADVIRRVAEETRSSIDGRFPETGAAAEPGIELPGGPPTRVITCDRASGVVVTISADRLAAMAAEYGCVFEVVPSPGDFLPRHGAAVHAWGGPLDMDEAAILATIHVADDRTMAEDPAFGFRQLVDIAERALSPGINDPTTAVQVIDQLHDMLAMLVQRDIPPLVAKHSDGVARVYLHQPSWETFVTLAFDEIRHYGVGSIQIMRRQRFLLEHLLQIAPPERTAVLRRQAVLLDEAVDRGFPEQTDREAARMPASQG